MPQFNFSIIDASDRESLFGVVALEQRVWGRVLHTVDELARKIKQGVAISAIHSGGKIIGTASLLAESDKEGSTPIIRNIPKDSVYAFGTAIDSVFRGRGLQKRLLENRVEAGWRLNKETMLGCVRPENGASMQNILSAGGRIIAYSSNFVSNNRYPSRLIWEIDMTLPTLSQEFVDKKDLEIPVSTLAALKREDEKILFLTHSGEENNPIDHDRQRVIQEILLHNYIGVGIQTLYTDDAGGRVNGIIFRHLSSFPSDAQKRLAWRKKYIDNLISCNSLVPELKIVSSP